MKRIAIAIACLCLAVFLTTARADDMCQVVMSYMNQYQDLYNEAQWRCAQYGGTWCDMQGEYLNLYNQWESQYNNLVNLGMCN